MNYLSKEEIEFYKKKLEEEEEKRLEDLAKKYKVAPVEGDINKIDVELPINTNKKILKTKFPYREYTHYTLESNFNEHDGGKVDQQRYIYKDKINHSKTSEVLKVSRPTLIKNFKKLEQEGILIPDEINPKVYKIKYTFDGKGDYIKVHKDILRVLVNVFNSDTIAVYYYLCARLRDSKQFLLREWIAESVGLPLDTPSKKKKNLDKISDITNALESIGLIGKEEVFDIRDGHKKSRIYYTLATYEEYKSGKYRLIKALRDANKTVLQ